MTPADLVRLFVRHRNAANLLMVVMLVMGAVSLSRMNTQFFPDFGIDMVSISVAWPGAGAEDVESNIVTAIEPEVRYLDNVHKVTSFAVEGVATILVEFNAGSDMQAAMAARRSIPALSIVAYAGSSILVRCAKRFTGTRSTRLLGAKMTGYAFR